MSKTKAEYVAEYERLKKRLEKLDSIGRLMSNVCWNLAHNKLRITEHSRKILKELVGEWDKAVRDAE